MGTTYVAFRVCPQPQLAFTDKLSEEAESIDLIDLIEMYVRTGTRAGLRLRLPNSE